MCIYIYIQRERETYIYIYMNLFLLFLTGVRSSMPSEGSKGNPSPFGVLADHGEQKALDQEI